MRLEDCERRVGVVYLSSHLKHRVESFLKFQKEIFLKLSKVSREKIYCRKIDRKPTKFLPAVYEDEIEPQKSLSVCFHQFVIYWTINVFYVKETS